MPWSKEKALEYQREYRRDRRDKFNAARRALHAANPEKGRSYQRKWRAANPELVKQTQLRAKAARKASYPQRREVIQARIRKYRATNPHKIREYNQRAYIKNREKILHAAARTQDKRRAVKIGAPLGDTLVIEQWQKSIRLMEWVRCHWCGTKVNGKKVHFDHVVPLSKSGSHSIENLCASCPDCNYHKSARLIADWVVGGQSFLNLT